MNDYTLIVRQNGKVRAVGMNSDSADQACTDFFSLNNWEGFILATYTDEEWQNILKSLAK